jgi:hypothetical protein
MNSPLKENADNFNSCNLFNKQLLCDQKVIQLLQYETTNSIHLLQVST